MTRDCENLPLALYSAQQVRELDAKLIAAGTPGFELMSRAAHSIWRVLRRRWPDAGAITVLAGHGNNGGDGYLIAALALRSGWQVSVLAVGDASQLQGDAALARDEAVAAGVRIEPWSAQSALRGVVVDAMLGTGLRDNVRAPYADAIAQINQAKLPVLAVDLPSGVSADTGQVLGCAVRADVSVTLIGLKLGLLTGAALDCVGELLFDDLQADERIVAAHPARAQRLAANNVPLLGARPKNVHKGQLGHVLVVGGDRGFAGAALLAAQSALRSGAGLVSLATRSEHVAPAQSRIPEVMTLGVASANQLMALVKQASVMVVGPGLGQSAWSRSMLSLAASGPDAQVWDADALNMLATGSVKLPAGAIITPHPGEAARLLGVSIGEVQADRAKATQALAKRFACVCVLKGAGTLIGAADGRLRVCDRGHPVMAGAGLGDVLAGLTGALLAQGLTPFEAASLAVWLHACAGEMLAVEGRGLAASDLCAAIRQLMQELSGV